MEKQAKSIGIEYLRVVCMFLVIINHTVAQFLVMPMATDNFRECWKINTPMISFGMPMFFFISGMLMCRQRDKIVNTTFAEFFKKKFVRLMLPYFVFSVAIMVSYRFFDINAIIKLDFWHLWFLPALLWCMCLAFAFLRIKSSPVVDSGILSVCIVLPFIPVYNLFAIERMLYWLFTFMGGILFEKYRPTKMSVSLWSLSTVIAIGLYILVWEYFPWEYQGVPSLPYMISILLLMASVCGLFERIIPNDGCKVANQVVLFVAAFSFSIYNVHYLVLGIVSRRPILSALNIFHINADNPIILVCTISLIVLVVSLSLCIGWQKLRQRK